ncbi:PREDICTED: histone H1-like [Lupinus angustifolius]|uniref:histone H1-like n=1 Tax=Lupinus angustifolius TaxID=3871 RepID=UPI00092F38D9|nr:PREDICTED: histone H1-like [Lupinus angustifolius]
MDSYSSSILPSSPPHRPVDAYPNLNIIKSFPNHPNSPATLAPPPPCNDDHPSYSKMICSAIRALKDENGSSKTAIRKYIAQEYKDLHPPNHDTLLTQNLKYMKEKNILIMVKRSYKFPAARSDKSMSLSLSSSSLVSRGHDCLPTSIKAQS